MVGLGLVPASARGDWSQEVREISKKQQELATQLKASAKPNDPGVQQIATEQEGLSKRLETLAGPQSVLSNWQLGAILAVLGVVAVAWRSIARGESRQREVQETVRAMVKALAGDGAAPVEVQAARERVARLTGLLNSHPPPRAHDMLNALGDIDRQLVLLEKRAKPMENRLQILTERVAELTRQLSV